MSPRGRAYLTGLAVTALVCLPLLPEILGTRRLVFRDAQITHWPWRRVAMKSLASGSVPFVNASASGGEPLLANPNASLLYPTMLLEKILSPAAAFNLHYLLHVLWAFFGARALARRLGLAPGASFFAAVAFAFSGIMMSYGSAFANSGAAASWLPWCAAATLDLLRARVAGSVRRASAASAIAFGLQLLAGEPVLSLLTLLFAAFLGAAEIFSSKERLARTRNLLAGGVSAGLLAAALASPLLLPLLAVLPLTYRGQHLYSARAFGASPFAAWRMIEWLFPRFDGDPGALVPERTGNTRFTPATSFTSGASPSALFLFWRSRSRASSAISGRAGRSGSREALSSRFSSPSARLFPSIACSTRPRRCAGSAIRSSSTC